MSHKNQTNYSKFSTAPAVEETPKVDVTPEPESVITIDPIGGIVSGCKKLNIREEASIKGKILCEVSEGTALMIDQIESTDDWFRVYTETGVEGYCMKKFVTIES